MSIKLHTLLFYDILCFTAHKNPISLCGGTGLFYFRHQIISSREEMITSHAWFARQKSASISQSLLRFFMS